jgi:hypothetical protein
MNNVSVEAQFQKLQQEVVFTGEAIESLRREHRAEIDALRLEIEAVRRCMKILHPEFDGQDDAVREQVLRETDPEAS